MMFLAQRIINAGKVAIISSSPKQSKFFLWQTPMD